MTTPPLTQGFVDMVAGCMAWATLLATGMVEAEDEYGGLNPAKLLAGVALVVHQDEVRPTPGAAEEFCAALLVGEDATDAEYATALAQMHVLLAAATTEVSTNPVYKELAAWHDAHRQAHN